MENEQEPRKVQAAAKENGTDEDHVFHHEGAKNVPAGGHEDEIISEDQAALYWKANIALVIKLMVVWFVASFGAGILFGEALDQFMFFGWPLGFWFAQQGAIYVFVALIFIYANRMKKLEAKFGFSDEEADT